MKVLVIGSGGREHAIVWKLKQSPRVEEIYCAPGNPGTAALAENIPLAVDDLNGIKKFAVDTAIDLVIIGPEYPLTLGLVDVLKAAGIRVFGPSQAAAALEGSKSFAKEIMVAAGVPTAAYATFSDRAEARAYIDTHATPLVIKVDGLAAGKGVFICHSTDEAVSALDEVFDTFNAAQVVIEEFLTGKEASFIVATNGQDIVPLAASHDYKRIFDNDSGPNTGGMGTVSPTPNLSRVEEARVLDSIMRPVILEMANRGIPYEGFLYAGLMIAPDGAIKVLEFNARLGDPETQVILRRMDSDLFELLYALSSGAEVEIPQQIWSPAAAVCVVLASSGYPASSSTGDSISGIEQAEGIGSACVFHAGTSVNATGELVTGGGRVLNVTALGATVGEAREMAYRAADKIQFSGMQFRKDIAL